jgi:FkbM family methyltransferase
MADQNAMDAVPYGAFAPKAPLRALIAATRAMPDSWLGKRAAYALRQVAITLLDGRPIDVETLGARMRLHPYTNICEKKVLFTPQYFDVEERDIVTARLHERFVFIDVGANVGAYSVFVAGKAGPGARILAIEPQPDIFERLVFNIRQNHAGSIKAVACAVADRSGELTLFLDPKNSGESSVKIIGSGTATALKVPAKTLLELIREEGYAHIDAIKLDVEGAEDIILEPFLRTAPRELHPEMLLIEDGSGRWQIDLPALVESKGYRLLVKTRLNFIYEKIAPP